MIITNQPLRLLYKPTMILHIHVSCRLYCSPMPCNEANKLRPPLADPPTLHLLVDTVYIEYGTVPPYYLGPCESLPAVPSRITCGAYAVAKSLYADGRVVTTDVSKMIEVSEQTDCELSSSPSGTLSYLTSTSTGSALPSSQIMTTQGISMKVLQQMIKMQQDESQESDTDTPGSNQTTTVGGTTASSDGSASRLRCHRCPMSLLHLPGRCPPGTYRYRCEFSCRMTLSAWNTFFTRRSFI